MGQLVIDAGNTSFKVAVFASNTIAFSEKVPSLSIAYLEQLITTHHPSSTILSSVVNLDNELAGFITRLPQSICLDGNTSLPIKNNYSTPGSLGPDRLANAVAAHALFKDNVLAVDAGTCLKFDFVNAGAEYLGGAISPGLLMRYQALNHFTARLPLLQPDDEAALIGNSTEASMHSGVLNGMLAEIEGVVNRYADQYISLKVILTGGDARYFLNHLKKPIFASPELTLNGLHSILLHNYP